VTEKLALDELERLLAEGAKISEEACRLAHEETHGSADSAH